MSAKIKTEATTLGPAGRPLHARTDADQPMTGEEAIGLSTPIGEGAISFDDVMSRGRAIIKKRHAVLRKLAE